MLRKLFKTRDDVATAWNDAFSYGWIVWVLLIAGILYIARTPEDNPPPPTRHDGFVEDPHENYASKCYQGINHGQVYGGPSGDREWGSTCENAWKIYWGHDPLPDGPSLAPSKATSEGFRVTVTLSDKARINLVNSHETVVIVGYLMGQPKQDALKQYVDEMGFVNLGEIHAEVAPGKGANFARVVLKQDAFVQTDGQSPNLNINVASGRKSSEDNLLKCSFYDGPLKSVQGQTLPIQCKLIGESGASVPILPLPKPTIGL